MGHPLLAITIIAADDNFKLNKNHYLSSKSSLQYTKTSIHYLKRATIGLGSLQFGSSSFARSQQLSCMYQSNQGTSVVAESWLSGRCS